MATIRRAEGRDADALGSLAGELSYPASADEMRERLALLSGDFVAVAEVDGAVVGWIHAAIVKSLESAPFGEIRGLVVTESQRGRGFGIALIDAAEQWVRAQGAARIRLRTNVKREDAHRFYEHRGFTRTKSQHVYDKRLAE